MEENRGCKVERVNRGFSHETYPQERDDEPELFEYHREAHQRATQYLQTLYFGLLENPLIAFYNPSTAKNIPPPAVKEAINKLDEINGRLLDRNIWSNLDLGRGQIQW